MLRIYNTILSIGLFCFAFDSAVSNITKILSCRPRNSLSLYYQICAFVKHGKRKIHMQEVINPIQTCRICSVGDKLFSLNHKTINVNGSRKSNVVGSIGIA